MLVSAADGTAHRCCLIGRGETALLAALRAPEQTADWILMLPPAPCVVKARQIVLGLSRSIAIAWKVQQNYGVFLGVQHAELGPCDEVVFSGFIH